MRVISADGHVLALVAAFVSSLADRSTIKVRGVGFGIGGVLFGGNYRRPLQAISWG